MRRRFAAEGAETAKSGESGLNRERATTRAFAPTNCHFSFGKASEGREESRHFRPDSSRSNTIALANGGFMCTLVSFEAVTVVEHG